MKKRKMLAFLLLLTLLLTACGGGDVSEVERRIGESVCYSKAEIAAAMDEVEKFFRAEYDGCKLIRLEYNEEKTREAARGWSDHYDAETVVLVSDFYVDDSGRAVTLEPNKMYRDYQWILTKTVLGWNLRTWGYG